MYAHFDECVCEVHKDGKCFVMPYEYEKFVAGLNIKDCEQGFEAFVSVGGVFCFDIDDMEFFFDDFAKTVSKQYIKMDELPVNPNGKLDRKNLPEPDVAAYKSEASEVKDIFVYYNSKNI